MAFNARVVWDWLHDRDWKTWIGHAVQGFVITGVGDLSPLGIASGIYATVVHFGLREVPGIVEAAGAGDTVKLVDGMFDLFAAFVGIAAYALLASQLV